MSLLTVTFGTPHGVAPVTARQEAVEETVTRYLRRVTSVDRVQYDPVLESGSAFSGSAQVAAFRTAPLDGDA